jgi:hypothetical protein
MWPGSAGIADRHPAGAVLVAKIRCHLQGHSGNLYIIQFLVGTHSPAVGTDGLKTRTKSAVSRNTCALNAHCKQQRHVADAPGHNARNTPVHKMQLYLYCAVSSLGAGREGHGPIDITGPSDTVFPWHSDVLRQSRYRPERRSGRLWDMLGDGHGRRDRGRLMREVSHHQDEDRLVRLSQEAPAPRKLSAPPVALAVLSVKAHSTREGLQQKRRAFCALPKHCSAAA